MLNVYLDGAMGKHFGKHWKIHADTPRQALSIIDANHGGALCRWIKEKATRFANYRVLVTFKNGKRECLSDDTYLTAHDIKTVRFTPVTQGAGGNSGWLQVLVGAAMIAVSFFVPGGQFLLQAGIGLVLSGVTALLTPKQRTTAGDKNTSHYFQGIGKNTMQGNPVPLIYGRCKVDGITLSQALEVIDQSVIVDGSQGKRAKWEQRIVRGALSSGRPR